MTKHHALDDQGVARAQYGVQYFADFPGIPFPVYEDEDVYIVSKPSGMHSVPAGKHGASSETSLLEWVFDKNPGLRLVTGRGTGEGGLIHRLDKETSGLLVFARTDSSFETMEKSMAQGSFKKSYMLCASPSSKPLPGSLPGRMTPAGLNPDDWRAVSSARSATDLLSRAPEPGSSYFVESHFRAFGPGAVRVACASPAALALSGRKKRIQEWTEPYRSAIIGAKVAAGSEDDMIFCEVQLCRGFRHQIRAHFAWIGLPLDGDSLYGGRFRERLMLHACRVSFPGRSGAVLSVGWPP